MSGWRKRKRPRLASAQELLPLEEITGDLVRLRGGECRAVLEAGSVNFALKSETEQDAILAGYRRFLNGLSYPLQVLVRVKPTDVEGYVGGLRELRSSSEALQRLARDHEAFVRRIARERTLLERRFFVVVPGGKANTATGRSFGLRWQRGANDNGVPSELLAVRRLLAFRCGEVGQGLAAFGVSTQRLASTELASLWQETLGGSAVRSIEHGRGSPVVIAAQRRVAARA